MFFRCFFSLLLLPVLSFGRSLPAADTSGKKPDMAHLGPSDIYWTKAEGSSFWFYYKPTHYFFKSDEFETITLENGELMVYLFESGIYLLLPEYINIPANKEQAVEFITARSAVFVRMGRGGFRIYDKGRYVYNVERIGMNNAHQYVYRSGLSDKRYWIEEYDFVFGKISKPVGVLSE